VDIDLIIYAANTKKDWSFVLIGPFWEKNVEIIQKLKILKKQKNIFLLGLKPYKILPNYIKGFDVCMIPHKITAYSLASFPLKVHEFLASGKPIVSTNLPFVDEYKDVIYVARNPSEFVEKIEVALTENNAEKRKKRISIASQNTWEHRIKSIEDIIKSLKNNYENSSIR